MRGAVLSCHANPYEICTATLYLNLSRRKLHSERASHWLEVTQHQVARPGFGPGVVWCQSLRSEPRVSLSWDRSPSPVLVETG